MLESNTKIYIENRGENLLPLVTLAGDYDRLATIYNGEGYYIYNGDQFYSSPTYGIKGRDSVPFVFVVEDLEGNIVIGSASETQKIIFDNSQNHIIIPYNLPINDFECYECTIDFSKSRVLADFTSESIRKKTNIKSIKNAANNSMVLYKIYAWIDDLPPDVRDSIGYLQILDQKDIGSACGNSMAFACAGGWVPDRIILGDQVDFETFYHEAAHTLTNKIEKQQKLEAEKELKAFQLELQKKYNLENPWDVWSNLDSFNEEDRNKFREIEQLTYEKKYNGNTLEKDWKKVAKGESFYFYGYGLGERKDGLSNNWHDGSDGPRNGCVRAYGCNNFNEDIATFCEPFAKKDYDFFYKLITPGQDGYDPRYRQKIDLLYKHKFITEYDYRSAIGDHDWRTKNRRGEV